MLGLGVGYPEQAAATGRRFGSARGTMGDYLTDMDALTWPPAPDAPYARIIAANAPKMLALAGELADGALPALFPAEFTAHARRALGPDKLLVVGLSVVGGGADHVALLPAIGGDFTTEVTLLERLAPALATL